MPKFSRDSNLKLEKADKRLQQMCIKLIEKVDFKVIETHRTKERQKQLLKEGKTKTLNSKHLFMPSKAIDIAPYPIDWKDEKRFIEMGKMFLEIAKELGIKVRWGHDWDMDGDLYDQKFIDSPHFELID